MKEAAARAGAAMDAPEVGAGAGPSAAEATPTRDKATTAAAADTVRILSFRVAAICFVLGGTTRWIACECSEEEAVEAV